MPRLQLLARDFYAAAPQELAPQLLNKLLLVRSPQAAKSGATDAWVGGRIAEVEAYDESEPASHSFRGPTQRCAVMFEEPGHLYVYRSYGVHWCANVVCAEVGRGSAVLIRALIPTHGIERQWQCREKARSEYDLCSGPGKLCQALAISDSHGGADLGAAKSQVIVASDGVAPELAPHCGPRIGIIKAVDLPWRWWLPNCRHTSLPRRPPRSADTRTL